MGKIRDTRRTRERILDAAAREFRGKGFDGATLFAIAQRARLSKQLIHHHFRSKEMLFQALLNEKFRPMLDFQETAPRVTSDLIGERFKRRAGYRDYVGFLTWEAAQKIQRRLSDFVVITGPSHAEEVAMEKLTYLTIASQNSKSAIIVAGYLKNHYLRTVISDDIYGTEYASVMKNIYAIAAAICIGLGYGDNFLAVLLSNAALELKLFIDSIHPIDRDINSSAYLGDLLVTGYSQFSRNRSFGTMIGKGYSVRNALVEMTMIAEGYYASKGIHKLRTEMILTIPIAETVYRILYENAIPSKEINNLRSPWPTWRPCTC